MDEIAIPEDGSRREIVINGTSLAMAADEDYERALQQMGVIVNSADNAFKRDYVGVIWKHLTV